MSTATQTAQYKACLRRHGATAAEIRELVAETNLNGVIDEDALAHERLTSLRGTP
jgi:hypothetical protein